MWKLMKLAALGALGYAAYDLIQRWRREPSDTVVRRELERAMDKPDEGRMGRLTGGGRGQTEISNEPSGMAVSHITGRGIVSGE